MSYGSVKSSVLLHSRALITFKPFKIRSFANFLLQSFISSSSMSSPSTSSSLSSPSLFQCENPCADPLKPNSEPENPRTEIRIRSASVSSVSKKFNLEMCTETLGFENGAMCFNCEMEIDAERKTKPPPLKQGRSAATVFPRPLTTIRGKKTLILRRKREEGRLLLIVFRPLVVEAERSGGRLVLRMAAKRGLKRKTGEEEEEEGEKEELAVNYGCTGKYLSVAARFGSDPLLMAI